MRGYEKYSEEDLELDCDWICSDEPDHVETKALIKYIMLKAKNMTHEEIEDLFKEEE